MIQCNSRSHPNREWKHLPDLHRNVVAVFLTSSRTRSSQNILFSQRSGSGLSQCPPPHWVGTHSSWYPSSPTCWWATPSALDCVRPQLQPSWDENWVLLPWLFGMQQTWGWLRASVRATKTTTVHIKAGWGWRERALAAPCTMAVAFSTFWLWCHSGFGTGIQTKPSVHYTVQAAILTPSFSWHSR